jgi:hypothetical protein
MTLTASDQGIELTGQHSNARFGWSMVKGFSGTNRDTHRCEAGWFQIVFKGQLSQADVTAFRSVLRLHTPGKLKVAKI